MSKSGSQTILSGRRVMKEISDLIQERMTEATDYLPRLSPVK